MSWDVRQIAGGTIFRAQQPGVHSGLGGKSKRRWMLPLSRFNSTSCFYLKGNVN
jgi:hypothetical protein